MKGIILKIISILILIINSLLAFSIGAGWWSNFPPANGGFIALILGLIGIVTVSLMKISD